MILKVQEKVTPSSATKNSSITLILFQGKNSCDDHEKYIKGGFSMKKNSTGQAYGQTGRKKINTQEPPMYEQLLCACQFRIV